jgi:hypothetical protein
MAKSKRFNRASGRKDAISLLTADHRALGEQIAAREAEHSPPTSSGRVTTDAPADLDDEMDGDDGEARSSHRDGNRHLTAVSRGRGGSRASGGGSARSRTSTGRRAAPRR